MKRCKKCGGTKQVVGMGGLKKKCDVCYGVGYVDEPNDKDVDNFLENNNVEVKKKGRPKKVE